MFWIPLILSMQINTGAGIGKTAPQQNYGLYIKVGVWGFVRNPGIYYLPPSSNVIDAISSAGGPKSGANLSKVKIIRNSGRNIIIVNINKYLKGDTTYIPYIEPGDMVYVQETFLNKLVNGIRFIGIVSGTLWIFYQMVYQKPTQK